MAGLVAFVCPVPLTQARNGVGLGRIVSCPATPRHADATYGRLANGLRVRRSKTRMNVDLNSSDGGANVNAAGLPTGGELPSEPSGNVPSTENADPATASALDYAAGNGVDSIDDVDGDYDGRMQGPTPAPTQAGVSTFGLGEAEAAFMSATYVSDVAIIEKSLDDGVDVHTRDVNMRTALHFCAGSGLTKVVRRLAELGADVNAQDMLGLTPLHMATGYKKPDTVTALVELGADPHLQCYGGELPVELGERLLLATPRKRLLINNPEHHKLTTIVQLLDSVTEAEEEEEEESENDQADGRDPAGVADLKEIEKETKEDGTKLVIRRKPKHSTPEAGATSSSGTKVDTGASVSSEAEVTVRRKQPASSTNLPDVGGGDSRDASFTIRRRGDRDGG
jgi:Ankyrin repeats (3 copies)